MIRKVEVKYMWMGGVGLPFSHGIGRMPDVNWTLPSQDRNRCVRSGLDPFQHRISMY